MIKTIFFAALAGFSFVTIPAHAQTCTEIGCVDGLTLKANPEFDWKNGNYDFYFNLGGRSVICRGRLPLKPCEEGPTFKCGSDDITITESGCALPSGTHAIGDIYIHDTPRNVILEIKRNGKQVLFRKVSPEYKTSQPNGPGCLPVCQSATHSLMHAE